MTDHENQEWWLIKLFYGMHPFSINFNVAKLLSSWKFLYILQLPKKSHVHHIFMFQSDFLQGLQGYQRRIPANQVCRYPVMVVVMTVSGIFTM